MTTLSCTEHAPGFARSGDGAVKRRKTPGPSRDRAETEPGPSGAEAGPKSAERASELLLEVLRALVDVDQAPEALLVELTARGRLVAGELARVLAAAARHRSAAWLGQLDAAIAAELFATRAQAWDRSLAALAELAAPAKGGAR